jgi:uncharacterized YccA/Bax inhibitor family protein
MANTILEKAAKRIGEQTTENAATYYGTTTKCLYMLALVFIAACASWITGYASKPMTAIVGAIGGFIVALIISFFPSTAPLLAPLYALLEGMALSSISAMYEYQYPGLVMNAVLLTFSVALTSAFLYCKRIVTVSERFRTIVITATLGILITYLIDILLMFFAGTRLNFIHDSGPLGIAVSLVIVFIASLNLFVDYDNIARTVENKLPKYAEWYCAFGVTVTLVWLYLEILRLLSKFRK